jgi:hypothetical protein
MANRLQLEIANYVMSANEAARNKGNAKTPEAAKDKPCPPSSDNSTNGPPELNKGA